MSNQKQNKDSGRKSRPSDAGNVKRYGKIYKPRKRSVQKSVPQNNNMLSRKSIPGSNTSKQQRNKSGAPAAVQEFEKPVRIAFLGGINEVGKNLTVIEYNNEMIIIDCGLSFPDDTMPGVDLVIPDFSYLEKNADKIKGIFITHGHEDHIGGLSYLLNVVNVPVYSTKFTLVLIENK